MSNETKKDWERPWNTEEIVEHADNWNLACDAALLNTLKAFGDKILCKADEVNKKIDDLCDNLDKSSLRVDLARNEFNSLRNSQFMEWRVYEDDETLLTKENEGKDEHNVPKDETMEDLRGAVALGLNILDKYYDKVEVTVSDSEDEDEEIPSHVYRRKDPYINRPLPYVIGSEQWYKKWHVGLQESSDSENEKSVSDKYSDSDSEDNVQTKDHSLSSELSDLSSLNNSRDQPVAVSTANTTKHPEFLASASSSDSSIAPTPRVPNFAEQLAAKLGNVIRENEGLLEEPEVNRRPIQKPNIPSDYGALFSDEPPPLDDNIIKEQGIFSGGKGLFDDEDDLNFWNPANSTKNRFDSNIINESSSKVQSKGLFDEDSDDDIFKSDRKPIINNQNRQPYLQPHKPAAPVFDEEPPQYEEKETKEKKKPTGGVSVFGNTNIFENQKIGDILKQRRSSPSDESDEEILPPKETKPKATIPAENSTIKEIIPQKTTANIKSNKSIISTVPKPVIAVKKTLPEQKSSLFDDDQPSLLESESKTKKSTLFDDLFGDDLFATGDNTFHSNLFAKENLFSEEIEDKLSKADIKDSKEISTDEPFRDVEKPPDIKNEYDYSWKGNSKTKIDSLFGDVEDDDFDIFKTRKTKKEDHVERVEESGAKKDTKVESRKTKISLFDDEFNDVDDFFSQIMKNDRKHMEKTSGQTLKESEKASSSEVVKTEEPVIPHNVQANTSKTLENKPLDSQNEKDPNTASIIHQKPSDDTKESPEKLEESNIFTEYIPEIISTDSNIEQSAYKSTLDESPREISSASTQSRNSISIPHVSFLDSVPPPDDGWDNNSDNAFDDLEPYGNDGFQSQPSSLFDNEPPSLIFNDTGIVRDHVDSRLDSVSSFDPSLTSSRRLSYDTFGDAQSNDALFLTKSQDAMNISVQPNLQSVPEISHYLSNDNTDITPSGNRENLYSSMSDDISSDATVSLNKTNDYVAEKMDTQSPIDDSKDNFGDSKPKILAKPSIAKIIPKDPEDEVKPEISEIKPLVKKEIDLREAEQAPTNLFDDVPDIDESDNYLSSIKNEVMQNLSDSDGVKISDVVISDKRKNPKSVSFDKDIDKDESEKSEDSVQQEDSDDMQNNISKIAERLQQISNKSEEKPKNIAIPRKLSHNLNINVNALRPGSAPPKRDKVQSPDEKQVDASLLSKSLPASNFSPELSIEKEHGFTRKPPAILRTVSESDGPKNHQKLEKSVSFDESMDVEILHSVTKNRVKIPVKRRPSSRRARQESLRNSVPDFNVLDDPASDEENATKDLPPSISKDDSGILNKEAKKRNEDQENIIKHKELPSKINPPQITVKKEEKSERTEFLKEVAKQLKKNVSLFDDFEDEPEDLFKTIEKDVKSVNQAKIISTKKKDDIFLGDVDDLFETTQNKYQEESKPIGVADKLIKSESEVLFPDNRTESTLVEDDIFSDLKVEAKEEKLFSTPPQFKSEVVSKGDLFSDTTKVERTEEKLTNLFDSTEGSHVKQQKTLQSKLFIKKEKIEDLFDSSDDSDDFFKSVKVKTKREEIKVERSESGIENISEKAETAPKNEKLKSSVKLFDFSDDDDFLESLGGGNKGLKEEKTSSKPLPGRSREGKLFDDENDEDEDIFSTKNKTKQDVKPSVINKKAPKASSLRKLENIGGDEDPLSAMLK